MSNTFTKGSEWRKWDLHVHTKETRKNDQFQSKTFDEFCVALFQKALENRIAAIGITDYFNIDNYKKIKEFVNSIESSTHFTHKKKKQIKRIFILPNVELRMSPVTDSGRLVNVHCLFNPDYEAALENNFFGSIEYSAGSGKKYKMNKQGLIDLGKFLDSSLDEKTAYKKGVDSFVVTHSDLQKLLDENRSFRENVIVAVSNSNKDGASAFQKHYDLFEDVSAGSLDAVRKSIYSISDCIFSSNEEDMAYFIGKKKDSREIVIGKCGSLKPCIHGSDAHTEKNLFEPDGRRYCWIKANPTFEGLKQILYEPEPGERVKISPVNPDQKDGYKIISKIRFTNTSDFPEEIKFNKNLCSIIGSRSSGKSALLAYVAHSVDKEIVEEMVAGPGEGADYHWDKIDIDHPIEWGNGQSNHESPGKIVYIPQNYLFKKSKDSDEIKEKIKPVLFKVLPDFKIRYEKAINNIGLHNQQISGQIDNWFDLSNSTKSLDEQLKNLGDKTAIEKEKEAIKSKTKNLKEKNQLSDEDLKQYQEISAALSKHAGRIDVIKTELLQLSDVSEEQHFFSELKITLSPALASLPKGLQDTIKESLGKTERGILEEVNKQVVEYKNSIKKEKAEAKGENSKIKDENEKLIEKYQKNIELQVLVKKHNEYVENLKKINDIEREITNVQGKLKGCEKIIKTGIDQRKSLIEELETSIKSTGQSILVGIKFGVEYGFDENLEEVTQKINIRDKSKFIKKGVLEIYKVRKELGEFCLICILESLKLIREMKKSRFVETF